MSYKKNVIAYFLIGFLGLEMDWRGVSLGLLQTF